ncbi:uncharacterized protein LOC123556851 [Mercenaria mercenaria]|uniref:uncharacterized protein LOC123556851 n=1 Tax=Mercenaria mercenaria TaxID=6596 RepID=UPI00234F7419|nr:uncharacterized protein LOC123556851 [Mercenaria mercenaria]XP_045203822.2 uncharacterized protein LOC123556851 [Mercenaria mercenaria]XP_045203823.2 uncharacterized protein LOC123556851 [Mercenaria mercenaria]XP_045203824.2 uncharacterized protein LOC123556851 [Mercenaria mercenaria]
MDSDVEFSFAEWDDLSETPLMHLSYFMQTLLPIRLIGWKNVKRHYESIISSNPSSSEDTYIVTGSNAEGYALPYSLIRTTPPIIEKPSDVDMLWVPGSIKISTTKLPEPNDTAFKGYLEYDGTQTGYARVCLPTVKQKDESFIFDEEEDKYYLSSTIMMGKVQSIIPLFALPESEKAWVQGPAFTIEDSQDVTRERMYDPNIGASRDFVFALACSPWPDIASSWKCRASKSKWLEPQLVDSIIEDGCHVVAVPSKKTLTPEREWRISFSASEGRLAREAVTDHQRQCYIYLKILRKQVMGNEPVLSSYVFKSVFLYCCEKLPVEYWRDYPGNCVLYMLDVLLECLGRKHVPTFFLPENNLIGHLSESEIDVAIGTVVTLRCDPITPILDYTDSRVIGYQSVIATFREVMKPLLDDMKLFKQHRDKNISIMNGIIATGYNICHYLLHEQPSQEEARIAKHQEAIMCLIDIYTLWLNPMGLNATLMQFINSAGLAIKDLEITCRFFEAVISLSAEYPEFSSVRGNLACMYHSSAYSYPDGSDQRTEYLSKAGKLFKQVYEETKCSAIDYVTYLVKQKRYEAAIHVLEEFTGNLDQHTSTGIAYSGKEQETLDEPLRNHVQVNGKIEADDVSFAYFYIVKCHGVLTKCDRHSSNVEIALQKFEKHCEKVKTGQALVLLEYAKSLSEAEVKPPEESN